MFTVRFSPEEESVIEHYRILTGLTYSEIIRRATMEYIEDEMDAEILREAIKENKEHPETYTFDEMMSRLGLE